MSLNSLDAIAVLMPPPYISALYGCCGPTSRPECAGSFCHRSFRDLVLRACDFYRLEAITEIQRCTFTLLLIVLTPNAPKCR